MTRRRSGTRPVPRAAIVPRASPTRPASCIAADPAGELFGYTKNEAGLDLIYRIGARQKLVGNYTWLKVDRELEPAPSTTNNRVWVEYRNSMWRRALGAAQVPVPAAALGSRSLGHQQQQQRAAHDSPVLFHGVRRRELRPEHGQARRRLEPDAAARHRHRRDVAQDRLQGPVLRPHRRQAPDLRRLDRLRRSRQAPRLGDRQLGQDPIQSGLPQHFHGSRARCRAARRLPPRSTGARRTPRTTGWSRCRRTGRPPTSCW